jgi:hypothetical protein
MKKSIKNFTDNFYSIPSELILHIYSFDDTYHSFFDKCIHELNWASIDGEILNSNLKKFRKYKFIKPYNFHDFILQKNK